MSAERPERRTYFRIPNLALDFPLSELDGVNIENPLAKSLLRTATVKRLKGVSQLGLVITQKRHGRAHFHTRYQHIGTVTEIGERILRQNGFDEQEINLGVAAFILHDVGITAFGDSTKPLDPKNLEEEAHWREASNRRITTLLRRNNISPQQVDAIIHNGGVLGKVLDIADRIAYVSRDLSAWIDDLPRIEEAWGSQPTLEEIKKMPTKDQGNILVYDIFIRRMGDMYKDVILDKDSGELYFEDAAQLGFFLMYRAALFRGLYMHPLNIGRETAFADILRPFYTIDEERARQDDSSLSPSKLRHMTDYDLQAHIQKYGSKDQWAVYAYLRFMHWSPTFEKFETVEQARRRGHEIITRGARIIGVREIEGFSPSTDFKVKDKNGNIVAFRDAVPTAVTRIDEEIGKVRGVYLFYTNDDFKMSTA